MGSKLSPRARVADVMTLARPLSRWPATDPATSMGARRRRGGSAPMRGRSIQATSRPWATESEVMRSRASTRSATAVRATARPPAASLERSRPRARAWSRTSEATWRAAPSRSTSASCRAVGRGASRRPSGSSASASWRVWPADSSSLTSTEACLRAVAAVRATAAADRAMVPWERMRSASSWASSTMRTWWSGRTPGLPATTTPSMAWLVTTRSAREAAARASSGKHSDFRGQDCPRHSARETETWAQARWETPGTRSSRSPVSVLAAHSRRRTTCSPRLASLPCPAAGWVMASPTPKSAASSSSGG